MQLTSNHRIILISSCLLALFCVYGLSIGYITAEGPLINSASIIAGLYFFAFVLLFRYFLSHNSIILCTIFGLIFSIFICVGATFIATNTVKIYIINILALAFVIAALLQLLFDKLPTTINFIYKPDNIKIFVKLFKGISNLRLFFFFWITIMLMWLPAFLALFPGYMSYDGAAQVGQLLFQHQLNAHHPIIHSLYIGFCFKLGQIFNSYEAGLFIYSLTQSTVFAGTLAYAGVFMRKHCFPGIMIAISILFWGLNPVIQVFAFTTTKDVLFSGFLLLFILYTLDMLINPSALMNSKKFIVQYIFIALLMTFTRNQGIYLIIASVPCVIFSCKKQISKIVSIFGMIIFAYVLINGPLYSVLDVTPTETHEMLSIPIQQIARVVNTDLDSLSEKEKTEIMNYLPESSLENYIPQISDPVKAEFNDDLFKKNPLRFVKLWISLGNKHFSIYIDGFIALTLPYIYPSVSASSQWSILDGFHIPNGVSKLEQHSLFPAYYEYLMILRKNLFEDIPILSIVVSMYLPVYVVLLCIFGMFRYKKWIFLPPLVILLTYICTLLAGPVACIRYSFPLTVEIPVLASFPFFKQEIKK